MNEEKKPRKDLSWMNPSFSENAPEWHPKFYGNEKMPPLTERDVQKQLTLERRERQEKNYLIAQETLFKIYERNKAVASGLIDVQKAETINEFDVNELVRKILRSGK